MTHTRVLSRILLTLTLLTGTALRADAIDDAITTHTNSYTTEQTAATPLGTMFGDDRTDDATPIKTNLDTLLTDIQRVIDNSDGLGVPSGGQNTTLTTLKTNVQALHDTVTDHLTLGAHHAATADALEALAKVDIENSQTTNNGHITTGLGAINIHVTDVETMHTANGVGVGSVGALKTAGAVTEFGVERSRALLAQELAVLLQTLLSSQGDLGTAINTAPDPDDDTVANYDTALNTAQAAIETEATAVSAAADPASTKALAIVATDVGTDDYTDFIADAAALADVKARQFKQDAIKTLKKVDTTRADIGTRIVQRQLLFDARTYNEREAIKKTLASKFNAKILANDDLQGVFSGLTELVESQPTVFPDTPPAPSGGRSAMGQLVDGKVKTYLASIEKEIKKLNPSPANQKLVDAVLASLKPAAYVRESAQAMLDWLKNRPKKLSISANFAADKAQYETEWGELKAELDANTAEETISSGTQSSVSSEQAKSKYTNLDTITSALAFKKAARAGGKRPTGPVYRIRSKGVQEFTAKMTALIPDVEKGSVDEPPTHRSNKSKPAPVIRAVPGVPSRVINGSSVLSEEFGDGDEIFITGSAEEGVARIRELSFKTAVADKLSANLKLFMSKGASVGIGAANTTTSPGQTVNVLGGSSEEAANSVQLIPDGNCTIEVNSDILIGGLKPFIPTDSFGKGAEHRITFTAKAPRTITVAANTTLDLSEFGNDGDAYNDNGKVIEFTGKIRLILEVGAKIRFPHVDPNKEKKGVVLYFNDESQLICQGDNKLIGKPWTGTKMLGADCKRNKLIGMGQLWFNKDAKMTINKPALVSVEADYQTPETNVTISLQRHAQLLIGTDSLLGGALQIGNLINGGSKVKPHKSGVDPNFPNNTNNSNYPATFTPNKTSIDFTLKLDGPGATCKVGRGGFLGFAAGTVNKDGAPSILKAGPNGIDGVTNSAWEIQRLYNVGSITLDITRGYFDHRLCVDGTNEDCSMLAIGALANNFPHSKYLLKLGKPAQSFIRGGGTIYFVDKDASMDIDGALTLTANPHTVDITDAAFGLSFSVTNTGKYTLLAPSAVMRNRSDKVDGVTDYRVYGRGIVKANSSSFVFAGPTEEFFYTLRMDAYQDGVSNRKENVVTLNTVGGNNVVGYVNSANTIIRSTVIDDYMSSGRVSQGLTKGYLKVVDENGAGLPETFQPPQ